MGEVQCERETPAAVDGTLAERIGLAPAMQPEALRARIQNLVEALAAAEAHPHAAAG